VLELQPGGTVTIPVVADIVGTLSNASPGEISPDPNTTLLGVTVTDNTSILGSDGEGRWPYVTRCRQAAAATSPGGPADAYRYLSKTLPGGDPLLNASGAPVNISRVYVSPESVTGNVDVYYASPSGAADPSDVTAANANIIKFGVPDTVTFGPSSSPLGGIAAIEATIPISYTVKIKDAPGLDVPAIKAEIATELDAFFEATEIGGYDQVFGAGVIYSVDLAGVIRGAHRGLYDVVLTLPGGASTPVLLGYVAKYSISAAVVVTV
jgi:hypothetical protein